MSDTQDYRQLNEIFAATCELSGAEREAELERRCAGDDSLRRRVEELLWHHDQERGLLARPLLERSPEAREVREAGPGDRIGPYKLLQQIGEGGFGVVYMAEQERPVRRRVALKVIKLGMDTRRVIARFEAERQALAMMDHPNIAKVLDAGATAAGRPYFVMELVRGEPITEYCDKNNLGVVERIRVFQEVCHAVQHAHQKGIIHRDIKPSNVLITLHDGRPVPKVIDFGIAKATGARLTEKTVFTEFRQFIGTPEYMSPEQAEMSGLDIDTRSDVYSLGVLLYELITGTTPFDARALRSAGYGELQRIIREETPPKPSTRLSTLDALPSVAAHRHTEPKKLGTLVRGDLDWIVMKALEKDRTRRYETADGLAQDIQRHLVHEPVVAGPPSAAYRVRKFVRRHRAAVAFGSVLAAALVLGVLGTSWQAIRATRAEGRARNEAGKATTVADLLTEMLSSANPHEAKGADYTVRALLDEYAARLGRQLEDQPEVEAAVRETMGRAYLGLGLPDAAEEQLERALELRRRTRDELDPTTLRVRRSMARVLHDRGEYAQAERALEELLDVVGQGEGLSALRTTLLFDLGELLGHLGRLEDAGSVLREVLAEWEQELGPRDPSCASVLRQLAGIERQRGRYAEEEELLLRALAIEKHAYGEQDHRLFATIQNLGRLRSRQGRYEEAAHLYERGLEILRRSHDEEHRDVLLLRANLAALLVERGRHEEAEPRLRELVQPLERAAGPDHPHAVYCKGYLARALSGQARHEEAASIQQELLVINERTLGPRHKDTLATKRRLADLYVKLGRPERAVAMYEDILEDRGASLEGGDSATRATMDNVAHLLTQLGRHGEAEEWYLELLAAQERALGDQHPMTLQTLHNLAWLYSRMGRDAQAEPLYETVLERLGDGDPLGKSTTMENLALLYDRQHRYEEAESQYRETLDLQRRTLGADHAYTLDNLCRLAHVYQRMGRLERASETWRELLALEREAHGERDPRTLKAMHRLACAYDELGRLDEALLLAEEALASRREVLGDADPDTLVTMHRLASLYEKRGRPEEAEALSLELLDLREQVLGRENRDTLGARTDLGGLYLRMGRLAEAEAMLATSLEVKRRVLGLEHPWTRVAMGLLAEVYERMGRLEPSARIYHELLALERAAHGDRDPHTLETMHRLACVYNRMGRRDDSRLLAEEALAARREVLGDADPDTLLTLYCLADLYAQQERLDEAEALYLDLLELRKQVRGEEDPDTLATSTDLGALYLHAGRLAEAEAILSASLEIERQTLGLGHSFTRVAMGSLIRVYERTDRVAEARSLRRELLEYDVEQARSEKADADLLNRVAWDLLTGVEPHDPELALELVRRANSLTREQEPHVLDTLALALHRTGDVAAAIDAQRRALELLPEDAPDRQDYLDALRRYEENPPGLADPGTSGTAGERRRR